MLTYIKATNIALIEEVELNLDPKLNIFTGETGAGKSMLSIQFNLQLAIVAQSRSSEKGKTWQVLLFVLKTK